MINHWIIGAVFVGAILATFPYGTELGSRSPSNGKDLKKWFASYKKKRIPLFQIEDLRRSSVRPHLERHQFEEFRGSFQLHEHLISHIESEHSRSKELLNYARYLALVDECDNVEILEGISTFYVGGSLQQELKDSRSSKYRPVLVRREARKRLLALSAKENQREPKQLEQNSVQKDSNYFYDIPLSSKKIAFVFDTSQSIRDDLPYIRAEFTQALERLGSETYFNVVYIGSKAKRWKSRFVKASKSSIHGVQAKLEDLKLSGGTELFEAIKLGMDGKPGQLVLLTDGFPSSGSLQDVEDILDVVRELNLDKKIRIDAIQIGFEENPFLKYLAAENGGVLSVVEPR